MPWITNNLSRSSGHLVARTALAALCPALAGFTIVSCAADAGANGDEVAVDGVEASAHALNYSLCTDRQQRVLDTYLGWLIQYTGDALDQFQHGETGERAATWFGSQDSTLHDISLTTLQNTLIQETLTWRTITCYANDEGVCAEHPSFAAYTFPDSDSEIRLCDRFWTDEATGEEIDNQTRLLILAHEYSHFAGTEDLYDTDLTSTYELAQGDPADAAHNAQNYACFIMNPTGAAD